MKKGVQKIYHEVARTYEFVNHVLTIGFDSLWRKRAAQIALNSKGKYWLDMCTGTGNMVKLLSKQKRKNVRIVAADFNPSMIALANERYRSSHVYFCLSDAKSMPFENETFDLIIIAFATRNIDSNENRLKMHFQEFHRLLKPGGKFINLETSQPPNPFVRRCFYFYAKYIVRFLGFLLSGSRSGYRYLSHTLPRFYDQRSLTNILKKSGFSFVESKRLFLGIAAIHIANKQI